MSNKNDERHFWDRHGKHLIAAKGSNDTKPNCALAYSYSFILDTQGVSTLAIWANTNLLAMSVLAVTGRLAIPALIDAAPPVAPGFLPALVRARPILQGEHKKLEMIVMICCL